MDDSSSSLSLSSGASGQEQHHQHQLGVSKLSHKIGKTTTPSSANYHHQGKSHDDHHHRPPVYTIDKSDFRSVVQRLTGSPTSERFSDPPPIRPQKPPSSRLQRMKPPPLTPFPRGQPEISQNPLAFTTGPLPVAPNPPEPTGEDLLVRPAASSAPLNPASLPPVSPSQFLLLSPICLAQTRSPKPPLASKLPSPSSNPSLADAGLPFSPSSPWGGLLPPSSPGFLRLPIPSSKS
ncbi:VQ motif-containing protein 9-like [Nymphaea colorata]|uniref:VQ motif-containing protein 9-like n=1 Tax=Nymphaea colorata TaxID=210225 RepID=UPI00129E75CD|nr:VQ motif-containing protein 9-like [Nymphaea colorata]XP_031491929.1 VQ motif-containing protein 9-like [Nymphaea colorata]